MSEPKEIKYRSKPKRFLDYVRFEGKVTVDYQGYNINWKVGDVALHDWLTQFRRDGYDVILTIQSTDKE